MDTPRRRSVRLALVALAVAATAGSARLARGRATAAAVNPLRAYALGPGERATLEGPVRERLAAGPYVYLRVATATGPVWVASLRATTPDAARVRAHAVARAARFHSARLGRDFAPLYFAAVRPSAPPTDP